MLVYQRVHTHIYIYCIYLKTNPLVLKGLAPWMVKKSTMKSFFGALSFATPIW